MRALMGLVVGLAIAGSLTSCAAHFAVTPTSNPMASGSRPRVNTFVTTEPFVHSLEGGVAGDSQAPDPDSWTTIDVDVRKPDLGRTLADGVADALERRVLEYLAFALALALYASGN